MEETSFLWILRNSAVRSPAYTLADLDELEKRLDAHIDGMVVSPLIAWRTALAEMKWEDSGEMFALASLAIALKDRDKLRKAFELNTNTETGKGLVSALGWQPYVEVKSLIKNLAKSKNPLNKFVGLSAYAIHREVPDKTLLAEALKSENDRVRSRALRMVGELKLHDSVSALEVALEDDSDLCRFNAAWSLALFKNAKGLTWLRELCATDNHASPMALDILLRAQSYDESVAMIRSLVTDEQGERLAIQAIGILGDPTSVSWLIGKMESSELARVAGESLTYITGVDLEDAGLSCEVPTDYAGGPSDDTDDDNVDLDEDDDLPWPDHARVSFWWKQQKSVFEKQQRYLCGYPINKETCQRVLRAGHQRARQAAAIEQALLAVETPFPEVRARASAQMLENSRGRG